MTMGKLLDHIVAGIEGAIAAGGPANLFSAQDSSGGTYVRDTTCWADTWRPLITCRGVYNSHTLGRSTIPITAIAEAGGDRRFGLTVAHYDSVHPEVGTTVRFVAADNQVITRTIAASRRLADIDVAVVMFDAALPESIYCAPLLPSNYTSYIANDPDACPAITIHASFSNITIRANVSDVETIDAGIRYSTSVLKVKAPVDAARLALHTAMVNGDSGSPLFVPVGTDLVLLTTWSSPTTGTAYCNQVIQSAINLAMTEMAEESKACATISLAGFDALPPSIHNFRADSQVVLAGGSTTLRWTTDAATSVSIDQGIGAVGAAGSVVISPAANTTYTLTATGPGGSTTATVVVAIATSLLPFSADRTELEEGDSVTLSWSSSAASLNINIPPAPYDTTNPTPTRVTATGVWVLGSAWGGSFLAVVGTDGLGYSVPMDGLAEGQLKTIPWQTINGIRVRFSEAVSVSQGSLLLRTTAGDVSPTAMNYDADTHTATWTVAVPENAKCMIELTGVTAASDGLAMASPWKFAFNRLAGDADADGYVGDLDQALVTGSAGATTAQTVRSDINANATVNSVDISAVKARLGRRLESTTVSGTGTLEVTPATSVRYILSAAPASLGSSAGAVVESYLDITVIPAHLETPMVINRIASGNWSDPAGWDAGTVPGADDEARIGDYQVTVDTDVSCLGINNKKPDGATGTGKLIMLSPDTVISTSLSAGVARADGLRGALQSGQSLRRGLLQEDGQLKPSLRSAGA